MERDEVWAEAILKDLLRGSLPSDLRAFRETLRAERGIAGTFVPRAAHQLSARADALSDVVDCALDLGDAIGRLRDAMGWEPDEVDGLAKLLLERHIHRRSVVLRGILRTCEDHREVR